MSKTRNNDIKITEHPFTGLKDADERLAKAKIAKQINQLLKERNLKQREAAELLQITQPEVSQLANGCLSGFTFDGLYRRLYALDMDVEIILKKHVPTNKEAAGIHVFSNLSV